MIVGGQGADQILGDDGNDDIIGGHTGCAHGARARHRALTIAARAGAGGSDTGDTIDAGAGNDWIEGDNGILLRTGSALSPRFRVLQAQTIFDANGLDQVTTAWQNDPSTGTRSATSSSSTSRRRRRRAPSATTTSPAAPQDDVIFGQLGDDTIQGDGSTIDDTGATTIDVHRHAASRSRTTPGIGADGGDYIEGNGGDDTIFGGLGQDDLIGGSSNLYSLHDRDAAAGRQRHDLRRRRHPARAQQLRRPRPARATPTTPT